MGERRVHLSCDTGEASDAAGAAREAALAGVVSAVSVACGGHAGDEASMRRAVGVARRAGCAVGAHPSYPDRAGFGRRAVAMEAGELAASLRAQLGAFAGVCADLGVAVDHVKAHGALYHAVHRDAGVARVFGEVVREAAPGSAVVVMGTGGCDGRWGGGGVGVLSGLGLGLRGEVFADRGYAADGSLVSRGRAGAVVEDAGAAAARAVRMVVEGEVEAVTGEVLRAWAETVCVHSDTAGAGSIARAVRGALEAAGVGVGVGVGG